MTTDAQQLAEDAEAQARLEQEQQTAAERAGGDQPTAPLTEPTPQEPFIHTFLSEPEDTNGVYVVLAASVPINYDVSPPVPAPGDAPAYHEVGFYRSSSPYYATKAALEDPTKDLGSLARAGFGVLIRAVPAMHWPTGVEATAYLQPPPPPPVLHIGRVLRARAEEAEPATAGSGAEAGAPES